MDALKRDNGDNKPKYKHVNVLEETHDKLREIATRENAKLSEIMRYLIDLAHAGKVDFDQGK